MKKESKELQKIKGSGRPTRKSITDQAASPAKENRKKAKRLKDLKAAAATVRGQVEGLAQTVKDRLGDRLTEKGMGKLEKQLLKMTAALDKAKGKLESRVKPAAKGLAKARKQLVTADEATEPTEVIKGLKKARKALKKI